MHEWYDGAMEPAVGHSGVSPRVIWIVAVLVLIVIVAVVAGIAAFALTLFGIMDRSDAHVCGLAAVRRSAVAANLVGTPMRQRGFTGSSTSSQNGELDERITFTVEGPHGSASVLAQGHRSALASHLDVQIGRDRRSATIYSGPFDCPDLHP